MVPDAAFPSEQISMGLCLNSKSKRGFSVKKRRSARNTMKQGNGNLLQEKLSLLYVDENPVFVKTV
jgi:hypothetical protein